MTFSPDISVLISTYNNLRYVKKKLDEILRQTAFSRAEFIFIETASPERERDLLEPFCAEHPNCRLLMFDDRKTLYESWNIGWAGASAPVVCYTNMDDCMHPRLLERVIEAFRKRPETDICAPLIARQQEDGTKDRFDPESMRGRTLSLRPGPFTAWRKDLDEKIGRFDPDFFIAGDKDFWSRAAAKRLKIRILFRVLYLYTRSPAQLSKEPGPKQTADKELQRSKSYPFRWPLRYKLSAKLLQPVWKKFPHLFLEEE